jgi:hypothetical protein
MHSVLSSNLRHCQVPGRRFIVLMTIYVVIPASSAVSHHVAKYSNLRRVYLAAGTVIDASLVPVINLRSTRGFGNRDHFPDLQSSGPCRVPLQSDQQHTSLLRDEYRVASRLDTEPGDLGWGGVHRTVELVKASRCSSLQLCRGSDQREAMAGAHTRPMRLTSLMKLRLVI